MLQHFSLKEFIDDNTFNIYPNPAHNLINIQNSSNNNINFIHLMDTSGKIIKTYKDDLEHLDVSSVSSGNYLLFIQTSKQKIVKKVIIK
ncbi:T9SS type A sorting domain-containing protein [Paenimyroides ummariense]